MNHAQKYLTQANRQIAELVVQIARQRAIVKHALDTGQRLEMAESLLDALDGSVRLFEKHRIFLLSYNRSSSAMPPGDAAIGRSLGPRRSTLHPPGDHNRELATHKVAAILERSEKQQVAFSFIRPGQKRNIAGLKTS